MRFAENALRHMPDTRCADLPLLSPVEAPDLLVSSPRVVSLDWLHARSAWNDYRRALLARFVDRIATLRDLDVRPVYGLIGGSFLSSSPQPGDLDALVFYEAPAGGPSAEAIGAMRRQQDQLDLRFVPGDAELGMLIKASCFFHTLYQSHDKGGGRASILVLLDQADRSPNNEEG